MRVTPRFLLLCSVASAAVFAVQAAPPGEENLASLRRQAASAADSATTEPCATEANSCFDNPGCYTCLGSDVLDNEASLNPDLKTCDTEDDWFNYMGATWFCDTDNFAVIDYGHCLWQNYVSKMSICKDAGKTSGAATVCVGAAAAALTGLAAAFAM
ncbi:unnamed protein product [Phaeothamnion confervicola]